VLQIDILPVDRLVPYIRNARIGGDVDGTQAASCRSFADQGIDILDPQDEHHRVNGGWFKARTYVERLRPIVQGVDEHGGNPDLARRSGNPQDGVAEKRAAKAIALFACIDSQTPQHDDRHRIGHVLAELPGAEVVTDRSGGKG
jgi:hypothetical protein